MAEREEMDLGLVGRCSDIDCRENWGRLRDVISLIRMAVWFSDNNMMLELCVFW